jgi:spore maturation protein CgeB
VRGLLRDGEHCAWYEDEEHASEQVERYLSDDDARERIRREGRAFVLAHHTFDHRVRNLLEGREFENPLGM